VVLFVSPEIFQFVWPHSSFPFSLHLLLFFFATMSLRPCGGGPSAILQLKSAETRVGRDRNSDLVINDIHTSRNHAVLSLRAGYHEVTQTGENQIKIERGDQVIMLSKGDTVRLEKADIIVFPKDHRYEFDLAAAGGGGGGGGRSEKGGAAAEGGARGEGRRSQRMMDERRIADESNGNPAAALAEFHGEREEKDARHRNGGGGGGGGLAPIGGGGGRDVVNPVAVGNSLSLAPLAHSKGKEKEKAAWVRPELYEANPGAVEDEGRQRDEEEEEIEGYSTGDEEVRSEDSWVLSSESEDISLHSEPEEEEEKEGKMTRGEAAAAGAARKTGPAPPPKRGRKRKAEEDGGDAPPRKEIKAVIKEEPEVLQVKTPYELFAEVEREQTRKLFVDFTDREVDMVLESRWENLAPEEQQKWVGLAPTTSAAPAVPPKAGGMVAEPAAAGGKGQVRGKPSVITREVVSAGFLNMVTVPELKKFLRQNGEEVFTTTITILNHQSELSFFFLFLFFFFCHPVCSPPRKKPI